MDDEFSSLKKRKKRKKRKKSGGAPLDPPALLGRWQQGEQAVDGVGFICACISPVSLLLGRWMLLMPCVVLITNHRAFRSWAVHIQYHILNLWMLSRSHQYCNVYSTKTVGALEDPDSLHIPGLKGRVNSRSRFKESTSLGIFGFCLTSQLGLQGSHDVSAVSVSSWSLWMALTTLGACPRCLWPLAGLNLAGGLWWWSLLLNWTKPETWTRFCWPSSSCWTFLLLLFLTLCFACVLFEPVFDP